MRRANQGEVPLIAGTTQHVFLNECVIPSRPGDGMPPETDQLGKCRQANLVRSRNPLPTEVGMDAWLCREKSLDFGHEQIYEAAARDILLHVPCRLGAKIQVPSVDGGDIGVDGMGHSGDE